MQQISLWGDDFAIESTPSTLKKIKNKISNKTLDVAPEKALKSDKLSIPDKLEIIAKEVNRILGRYKENTLVINDYDVLVDYIDKSIKNGIIAVDTETSNSLDYLTCKLMGGCIYTPDMKQAYIPINHTDINGILLPNQINEKQIKEQFDRLNTIKQIYHNGKFDYQVLKCTTGFQAKIYWDTLIGAKMLDENEPAGLKYQYIDKIDSSIEHYDIEHLFKDILYQYVPPELFALYAATDSFMTYELFDYQLNQFNKKENKEVFNCFMNVEMPCVEVIAEMELTGVSIDKEYADKLSTYYHKQYDELQDKLNTSIQEFLPKIEEWRQTSEAQYHPRQYYNNTKDKDITKFPLLDEKGQYYKEKKSKSEQLDNPLTTDSLNSPTQLAILLYDVLKVPEGIGDDNIAKSAQNYKPSRSTDSNALKKIDEQYSIPLLNAILKSRECQKLIGTYIDTIPQSVSVDGRVHTHFNQLGAGTGRTSSSDPVNLQNIPSHNHLVRPLFKASNECRNDAVVDDTVTLHYTTKVNTEFGWKYIYEVSVGNLIFVNTDESDNVLSEIVEYKVDGDYVTIKFCADNKSS